MIRKKYDINYGDSKVCKCGHTYVRHHDPWESMLPIGCKYCMCEVFDPLEGEPPKGQNVYYADLHSYDEPPWNSGEPSSDGVYVVEVQNRYAVIEKIDGSIVELPSKVLFAEPIKKHYAIPNLSPNLLDPL